MESSRKYKVRSGTDDSGKEYETKMATLLALRCIPNSKDFWMASNADGVGDFDDIILRVTTDNSESSTFLLQLKHKDNPNNLTNAELEASGGRFSLKKYCEEMTKLRSLMEPANGGVKKNIVSDLGPFSDIYFVLFTNRGMGKIQKDWFMEMVREEDEIPVLKNILNTAPSYDSVFRFDLSSDLPQKISSDNRQNFENFRLLTNQFNENDLNYEIANELEKFVPFNSPKLNADILVENLVKYVKDWAKGNLGQFHYYLTRDDIVFKLTQLFFSYYEVNLKREQFSSLEKGIWNELVREKTVTMVDANEPVLRFLIGYVGGEVKDYCQDFDGNWTDKFPDEFQKSFYKNNTNLNFSMRKLVGNRGKITLLDVYKCLWRVRKVPLLIKTDSEQDCMDFVEVLKLSNYSYKVIIVVRDSSPWASTESGIKVFQTLQDLDEEERGTVLDQPATLQGRPADSLRDLLDESMFKYVKCSDIISILTHTYNVGNRLENLPKYFIQRSIMKTFMKSEVLRCGNNADAFLLENCSQEYLTGLSVEEPGSVILFEGEEQVEDLKSSGRNLHRLSFHDKNCWEWKKTLGKVENIRNFQARLEEEFLSDISCYYAEHVNIISEVPGMGKSFLMDYIAHNVPSNKWVMRIDLKDHRDYYKGSYCKNSETTAMKHLEYFYQRHKYENPEIAQDVFERLAGAKQVVVLLDGFDEISVSHKDEVMNIAKSLHAGGFYIWLTTRPHMKLPLEEEFDTFAISLRPFTDEDQKSFLVKYFSHEKGIFDRQAEMETFALKLLEATKKNLLDNDAKFTGIPLQTKLLADYFIEKCQSYLSDPTSVDFSERFDLLSLYQNFVDRKLHTLCQKFGDGAVDARRNFEDHQKLFALKYVFVLDDYSELEIFSELNDYKLEHSNHIRLLEKKKLTKIQLLQRDGIITADELLYMGYIHRTFAEYLSAQWLSENLHPQDEALREFVHTLIKRRFTKDYNFLFNVFDRILAKKFQLHLKIINGKIDEAKRIVQTNPKCVKEVDLGGRTILHMVALYDDQDLLGNSYTGQNKIDVMGFVHKLPDSLVYFKTDIVGYSALDYALAYDSSLILANAICEKSKISCINACIDLNFFVTYLNNCEKLELKALFDVLVPYFVSRDMLQYRYGDMNLKHYIKKVRGYCNDPSIYVSKTLPARTSIMEFLASKGFSSEFDLRFAILFGSEDDVERLVSNGQEINQKDVDDNTPLHYALLRGRASTVETLLSNNADVNIRNSNNETPLHLAFVGGNPKVIRLCLSQTGANLNAMDKKGLSVLHHAATYGDWKLVKKLIEKSDINKQDISGNTPLHLALKGNHSGAAKALIKARANISIVNKSGKTILHHAVRYGYRDLLTDAAFQSVDRNVQDDEGNTPLHLELNKESPDAEVVKFLLSKNADVNIQNMREETSLHLALNRSFEADDGIVGLLINHGANVNIKNSRSETAIHLSINSGNTKLVLYSLPRCLDLNQQNCSGDTYLHLASRKGDIRIVQSLLKLGADVNVQNCEDQTPLHCAAEANHIKIISALLNKHPEVNKKDCKGNTVLHLAAMNGNESAVRWLVNEKYGVWIPNKRRETALDLAKKRGYENIAVFLLQFRRKVPTTN